MIVGIDLGTTHSLIGAFGDQGPQLFPNALGSLLTPSAVSVDGSGAVIVGQAARDRLITHPESSVATFKRWMGSSRSTRLGECQFRPEELSALILRSLLADAEAATGEKVTEAVISVPAYFSDAQRRATRAAGELAGIRCERLINEPTAAALAYGLQERRDGGRFLVLDLGGGTFDVSVLEMFEGVIEVHASAGDNYLGGEDFLIELADAFCREHGLQRDTLALAEQALLAQRCERAKRALSSQSRAEIEVRLQGRELRWEVTEERFARLAEPLLQRLRVPLERALRDARLTPAMLDEVVLVGGASRMPMVARIASRMLGRLPLRHINPDEVVALGAAVAAGMKARNRMVEETILTDVCPYTLGVDIARRERNGQFVDGYFAPVIQRNSVVPVSRVERFWPLNDEQRSVKFGIYQGESPRVEANIHLGELEVPIPRLPKEQNPVDVRFTYDVNGVLQVEATVIATGQTLETVLEKTPGVLGRDEIRARLAALSELKIHPRDKQENIAVLARAERLYEELLDARPTLQDWIANFRAALDSQDPRLIAEHRQALTRALDGLESGVPA